MALGHLASFTVSAPFAFLVWASPDIFGKNFPTPNLVLGNFTLSLVLTSSRGRIISFCLNVIFKTECLPQCTHTHTHINTHNTHTSHALSHLGRGQWRMEKPDGSTFRFLKALSEALHTHFYPFTPFPVVSRSNECGHWALDFVAFKNIFWGIKKLNSHSK